MADLMARFKLVDEMSEKLGNMAESGQNMITQWEQAGEAVNAAFEGVAGSVAVASSSVDGVATSIEDIQGAADSAASSADNLSDSLNSYGAAAGEAVSQTDYWTDAVGNYDRSALEAVYTTEELVEMGLKSAQALEEQERMLELCDQSASSLSRSMEATADITGELSSAMEEAASLTEELSKADGVSAETKAELAKASVEAAEALNELAAAQEEAQAAMEAYDSVMASGTTDLETLEAAAERAGHAAENLAEANGKASDATEELAKASEKASEEQQDAEKSGIEMAEGIAGALAAAGITATVKDIAVAVYDLADAYSEAEKIIVNATGATGEALDGLGASMLAAYSGNDDSLADTAAAVGEINTRMGLTGEKLTEVTGLFMDYADITGTNAVNSVQNLTKIMNKWNIEATDVESVMDKIAYAGQISGASVDGLSSTLTNSSATFQALGMDLDNAISLLADLELYGTSSTTTVTGLRTAVNNFSKDGLDAQDALRDVIEQIANMEDASEATALAVETFGSRAGQELAGAIRSGAISVDSLTKSLDVADGTLAKTAEAGESLAEKWQKASNNIGAAFTTAVQPALDGISGGFAEVANGFGTFLNEHPAVTKAITAIGVGLGVAVIAIAAVAAASLTAIPAVAALGTAISAAIWPITLIAAGVAAVVGVVMLLADAFSAAEDETAGMTATTRAQYYELQDLNAEYEEACEKYGENSEEALRLKYQVDDLSAAFEANRQTVEEFTAEVDSLCESVNSVSESFNNALTEINAQETGSLALIQKYSDLTSQTELTGAQQKELEAVTKKLSQTYPELSAQIDSATISTEDYVEAMKKACEQQAEELRQQQAQETYVEALAKRAELTEEIAKAQENVNLEQQRMDDMSGWSHFWTAGEWDDLEAYQAALDELNAAMAENDATIAQIEQGWADIAAQEEAAAEATVSWEDAASEAYENVRDRVIELCEAYGEAYNAALESFEGQFGLFDEASMKSDEYLNSTVENAQAALDSQLAYWDTYLANVEVLKNTSAEDLGVTQENYEALMAYAQDGSEQAAGLAASMAKAIQDGDAEAVAALANTVGEVNAKQEEIAAATADWITDFTAQMDEIEKEMQDTVDGMNLDTEAAASATATIKAYADSIRAGKAGAVAAAEEVANAVSAAFASARTTVSVNVSSSGKIPGHADGTTNAEDVFIAGEEGPELIVGHEGSTVFPASETDRIIRAIDGADYETATEVFERSADYSVHTANYSTVYEGDSSVVNTYENGQEADNSQGFFERVADKLDRAFGRLYDSFFTPDEETETGKYLKVDAYANGTTDSDSNFIAGENGPELIVGHEGSTVFPASETDRLIEALGERQKPLQVFADSGNNSENKATQEQVKRILLEIAGSGAIEVGGGAGVDKESIIEILYEHLKPILMNIIQGEIYEEGELSYEY